MIPDSVIRTKQVVAKRGEEAKMLVPRGRSLQGRAWISADRSRAWSRTRDFLLLIGERLVISDGNDGARLAPVVVRRVVGLFELREGESGRQVDARRRGCSVQVVE